MKTELKLIQNRLSEYIPAFEFNLFLFVLLLKELTTKQMVECTTNALTSHIIMSIFVQSLTHLKKIFGLDAMTKKKTKEVKELYFQVKLEVLIGSSNFVKLEAIFWLKKKILIKLIRTPVLSQ